MIYWEGLSPHQVADILDIGVGWVYNIHSESKKILSRELKG